MEIGSGRLRGWDRVRRRTQELAESSGFKGLFRRSTLNAALRLEMLIKENVPLNKTQRWLAGLTFRERLHYWVSQEDWKTDLQRIQKVEETTGVQVRIVGHERWRGKRNRKSKAWYQERRWRREEQ